MSYAQFSGNAQQGYNQPPAQGQQTGPGYNQPKPNQPAQGQQTSQSYSQNTIPPPPSMNPNQMGYTQQQYSNPQQQPYTSSPQSNTGMQSQRVEQRPPSGQHTNQPPAQGQQSHAPGPMIPTNMAGAASRLRKASTADDERRSFAEYLNTISKLQQDPHLRGKIPINPTDDSLYRICAESILLSKFINSIREGTVDERSLCTKPNRNVFETNNNHALAISGARTLGCKITNIGPEDLTNGNSNLILGVLWQLIRLSLLSHVNLAAHPSLIALKEANEDVQQFIDMAPEMTLLRWFNHQLRLAGHPRRITNFSTDIQDGDNYTILLHQIAPLQCGLEPLHESDPLKKAEMILKNTEKIGCRQFIQPQDIVNGNDKLNLAFVANLFNSHPALSANANAFEAQQKAEEIQRAVQEQIQRKEQELRARMENEERVMQNRLQQMENEWRERMKQEEMRMKQQWKQEEDLRRAQLEDQQKKMTEWEREQARKNEEWMKAQADQNALTQQKLSELEREKQRILDERRKLEEEKRRRESQPWNAPSSQQPSYSNTSSQQQQQQPPYSSNMSSSQYSSYTPPVTSDNPYNTTAPMGILKEGQNPNVGNSPSYNQGGYSSQYQSNTNSSFQYGGKSNYVPPVTSDNPYNTTAPMGILKEGQNPNIGNSPSYNQGGYSSQHQSSTNSSSQYGGPQYQNNQGASSGGFQNSQYQGPSDNSYSPHMHNSGYSSVSMSTQDSYSSQNPQYGSNVQNSNPHTSFIPGAPTDYSSSDFSSFSGNQYQPSFPQDPNVEMGVPSGPGTDMGFAPPGSHMGSFIPPHGNPPNFQQHYPNQPPPGW